MRRPRNNDSRESGFAMLMVFVLAAVIAISLYYELPRAMFEHTRQKEQLLIDRGEQYTIAIRRFYVKFGRWPVTMDELENTNNIRFLRHQYVDPMTGKADWRIIHETAGVLTDSLVHPANPLGQGQNGSTGSTGSTGNQTFGSLTSSQPFGSSFGLSGPTGSTADQPVPKAWGLLFRPSDRGPLGTAHGGVAPDDGTLSPSDSGYGAGAGSGYPDAGATNQNPLADTSNQNATAPNSNPGMNQPAVGAAGATGASGANAVTQMIQNGLTNPQQSGVGSPLGGNPSISGGGIGIAGVASKSPMQGIKLYKDHSKYKEWEFVFDATAMQQLQIPQQGQQQPGLNQPGSNQPGFNQPGFNQPGFNQPGSNQPGSNQPGQPPTSLPPPANSGGSDSSGGGNGP